MTAGRASLVRVQRVSEEERDAVAAIAAAAEAVDGINPLDDQVRSELAYGAGADSHHILVRLPGEATVVAYAHAVRDPSGASGHLVVHPDHRRRGIGRDLVDRLLSLIQSRAMVRIAALGHSPQRHATLRLWAHGNTAAAQALAAARGFEPVRELWQMRRDLCLPVPAPTYPEDVAVRTFESGRDDEAWVTLNAAAFAAHPEQGRLTLDDLRHRIGEPWFDPAGFFLAERDGELLGSHWTKVHPAEETGSQPVGEVYAVGIHPRAQGLGLGKALTLTGLEHLRDVGLAEVMLYVDADNAAATGLYQRLGFTTSRIDVMYATR
jgi:mycothiol synthase